VTMVVEAMEFHSVTTFWAWMGIAKIVRKAAKIETNALFTFIFFLRRIDSRLISSTALSFAFAESPSVLQGT
jgi:hypothetical protein